MPRARFRQPLRALLEAIQASAAALFRLPSDALDVPEGYQDDRGFHYGAMNRLHGFADRPGWQEPGLARGYCKAPAVPGAFPREGCSGRN
jgi:hypothetical protein